jgi:hypothetical protein
MKTLFAVAAAIAFGLLASGTPTFDSTVGVAAAQAQNEHHAQSPVTPPAAAEPSTPGGMHGKMMADRMLAADTKLQDLVKKMNEATGPAKMDAIAAAVNELVEQHRAMRGMMTDRMDSMKGMMTRPDK